MTAFRDIDALLRMMAREREILKFLFTGRGAPSLRREQALEHFLSRDGRNPLLIEVFRSKSNLIVPVHSPASTKCRAIMVTQGACQYHPYTFIGKPDAPTESHPSPPPSTRISRFRRRRKRDQWRMSEDVTSTQLFSSSVRKVVAAWRVTASLYIRARTS